MEVTPEEHMDLNETLAKKLQDQIGALTFQLLLKDSIIELLNDQIKKMTSEKKEELNGVRP